MAQHQTQTTPLPPPLRSRSVLTEIPIRMGLLRVSTDELFTNNNNVNTVLNPALIDSPVNNISSTHSSPAPSPDELVIRQRGRRRISLTWLSTSPERQLATSNPLASVPVLCTPPKLPTITMTLRSSPRKRILEANPTTPTRTTITTPDKRNITWSASSSCSSVQSNAMNSEFSTTSPQKPPSQPSTSEINCSLPIISHPPTPPPSTASSSSLSPPPPPPLQNHPISKRLRFTEKSSGQMNSSTPLSVILKGLSHDQLSEIIQGLIISQPELETEIRDRLPTPDIRPMKEQLIQLKKNIFKSLPTSRLVKKTDSASYSRASIHLFEFKKAISEQTRTLYQSKHWDALYDYVQMAWLIVRGTPIWDNNSHNNTRRQCFRILTSHLNVSLKSGGILLGEQRLNEMKYRSLNQMIADYDDILCVESLLEKLLQALEQAANIKGGATPAHMPTSTVERNTSGRRRISLTWLSTSPERQLATSNPLASVPVLCTPPKLPTITMTLRSSPRKRILEANPTTPTRTTITTPDKRNITWSASSSCSSVQSNAMNSEFSTTSPQKPPSQPSTSEINCSLPIISHPPTPPPSTASSSSLSPPPPPPLQNHPISKRLRFTEKSSGQMNSSTPLSVILKGLSHDQLSEIIQGLIISQPELETEIRDRLPTPDIRPMKEQLIQLKKNIFKSLPTSRLVKKTDSASYSRASIHLFEFKKAISEQTRTLYQSKHWDALYDYVQMAWLIVRGTPIWDNNSHNNTRRQCFRILTSHLNVSLKSGGILLGEQRLNEMKYRSLNQMIADYDDILCVESLLEKLLQALEQAANIKGGATPAHMPTSTVERNTSGKISR